MRYVCFYCDKELFTRFKATGQDDLKTIDHVIPRSRGGNNNHLNKVAACHRCNNIKSDLTPSEFVQLLLSGYNFHIKKREVDLIAKNAQILANRVSHHVLSMTIKGEILPAIINPSQKVAPVKKRKRKTVPKNPQNEWVRKVEERILNNNRGYKPLDAFMDRNKAHWPKEDIVTKMLNAPQENFHY